MPNPWNWVGNSDLCKDCAREELGLRDALRSLPWLAIKEVGYQVGNALAWTAAFFIGVGGEIWHYLRVLASRATRGQ